MERIVENDPPVIATKRPPPLSGGTLLVTRDQAHAIVSDPERDRIVVVALESGDKTSIALQEGDEPGRAVEDASGRVHVGLRAAGDVVTIDVATASIRGRRHVCSGPRGLAFDQSKDGVVVACADGQLITLAADPSGGELARVFVEPDLRDVILAYGATMVSTFRSSELLTLDVNNAVIERTLPPDQFSEFQDGATHAPHVAWRTFVTPAGDIVMLHQFHKLGFIPVDVTDDIPEEVPYGSASFCEEMLVQPVVSMWFGGNDYSHRTFSSLGLVTDVAVSTDGARVAVIDTPNRQVLEMNVTEPFNEPCTSLDTTPTTPIDAGTPVAVAMAGNTTVVQTREPATLVFVADGQTLRTITLDGESRADTGFDIFYNMTEHQTLSGLACASCHPEGRDDGHVWNFSDTGLRRTQSLAGTVANTAPFHWNGDLTSMSAIVETVFARRMGGPAESGPRVAALQSWIESIPPVRGYAGLDEAAVERGEALFESDAVGCASCHSGEAMTNNLTVSIGREEPLQVPSLIGLGTRAPYMHDGCAPTLRARFDDECGGYDHGTTSELDEAALGDLVAYLNSL